MPNDRPKLKLKVRHIGPVMELDGELSSARQNLIFAPNGTGKSFLARAFRVLDELAFSQMIESEIPECIVSEEAERAGRLELLTGTNCIAELEFDVQSKTTARRCPDDIFHVFSTDFVDSELRSKNYEIEGEKIQHEIIVGKENHELDSKLEELSKLDAKINAEAEEISSAFLREKQRLKQRFAIAERLTEYRVLTVENYFGNFQPSAFLAQSEFEARYDKFRAFPLDPQAPAEAAIESAILDLSVLQELLLSPVSISSVAEEFRNRIKRAPDFFSVGVELHQHNESECPFCTQELNSVGLSAIAQYESFFKAEEARTQTELNRWKRQLAAALIEIDRCSSDSATAALAFNEFKQYFEKFSNSELTLLEDDFDELRQAYKSIVESVDAKLANLSAEISNQSFSTVIEIGSRLRSNRSKNEAQYSSLEKLIRNVDAERLSIQREVCSNFVSLHYEQHKASIIARNEKLSIKRDLEAEIESLRNASGEKVDARQRVAATFAQLLKYMFGEKYSFDEQKFVVKRNLMDMTRGGNRTLSDGEKSVFAFCYYVAQIHFDPAP